MKKVVFISLMCFCSALVASEAAEQTPRQLLEAAFELSDIYSRHEIQDFSMRVDIRESRKGKLLEHQGLRLKHLKTESVNKTILHYHEPAGIKGTAYLLHVEPGEQRPEAVWVFLPSFNKTQKLSAYKASKTMPKSLTSLASLNINDIDLDDYSIEEIEQFSRFKLTPKGSAGKVQIVSIQEKTGLISKIVTLNPKGEPSEVVEFSGYKPYAQYWLPTTIVTRNITEDERIKLTIDDIELNTGLLENDFSVKQLGTVF